MRHPPTLSTPRHASCYSLGIPLPRSKIFRSGSGAPQEGSPMSVNSIYNSYSSVSSMLQGLGINLSDMANSDSTGKSTSSSSSSSASGKSAGSKQSSAYGTSSYTQSLAEAVKAAMDDLGLKSGDRVTFQTLSAYRTKLEAEFKQEVSVGLLAAGVDKDAEFRLAASSDGKGVQVISDSPDKEKIEKYFKDNPEMVEKFQKIQGLNKMEETRKSQRMDVNTIKERLQLESMTAWFSDSSSFMAFSGQGAAYYSGINAIA